MKPQIIILYKDKSYKIVKESNFHKYFNKDKISLLLFQSLSNSLIYYPILPNEKLLSNYFSIDLTFDISNFDFDANYINPKDSFTHHYETTSLCQFIEYLSIFYKINGSAELVESAFLGDGYSEMTTIYPVHYHIDFDNYESIDSGQLQRSVTEGFLNQNAFSWIMEDRMSELSDILVTIDSNKKSVYKLPILMVMTDDTWAKIKKVNHLPELNLGSDELVLIKTEEFNCYYLTQYELYHIMSHTPTFNMDIIIAGLDQIDGFYREFALSINKRNQIDRDALCHYIKDAECSYHFVYNFSIGDVYLFITWISFMKNIIQYLLCLFKTEDNEILLLARHIGNMTNMTFTYKEIMNNQLSNYLYKYIMRRGKDAQVTKRYVVYPY